MVSWFTNFKESLDRINLIHQTIKRYKKSAIYATDFMPDQGLKLWFPHLLQNGGSGFRLITNIDQKHSSVGWYLLVIFGWAHREQT